MLSLSPFSARAAITILLWANTTLVFPIDESMEAVIQRKVEIIQRLIKPNPEGDNSTSQLSPAIKKHFELEIDILMNAPRKTQRS